EQELGHGCRRVVDVHLGGEPLGCPVPERIEPGEPRRDVETRLGLGGDPEGSLGQRASIGCPGHRHEPAARIHDGEAYRIFGDRTRRNRGRGRRAARNRGSRSARAGTKSPRTPMRRAMCPGRAARSRVTATESARRAMTRWRMTVSRVLAANSVARRAWLDCKAAAETSPAFTA